MKNAPPQEGLARNQIRWRRLFRPAALAAISSGLLFGFLAGPASAAPTGAVVTPSNAGTTYVPVAQARIVDTRAGSGSPYAGQAIAAGQSLNVQVSGNGGIPDGAAVAVLNVTAINPTQAGFLSVNPEGQANQNSVSNLNFIAGQTVANLVTVSLSSGGGIEIYNQFGTTNVAVDVEGYYGSTQAANGSGLFNTISPDRALGNFQSGAPIGSNSFATVPVAADNGVPAGASAVVVNLTAAGATAPSYLSAYPAGATPPPVSNLNFVAGQTVANRATVALGTNSAIDIYNLAGTVNVDVDVTGYYTGAGGNVGSAFVPITPQRLLDTRTPNTAATPIAPGTTEAFNLSNANIPTSASAVATNVTAIPGNAPGYLTVYPTSDSTVPGTSDVNWAADQVVPNFTIADTAATGYVNIYNSPGSTLNLAVDAFGYFAPVTPPVQGLTITATPQSVSPSGTASIVATVTSNGVPDGNVQVQIIVDSPTTAACQFDNDLDPTVGNTDMNGQFTSTYTAPAATGSESTCLVTAYGPGGLMAGTTITNLAS